MAEYLAIPLAVVGLFLLWMIWLRKLAPAMAGVKNISLEEYRQMFRKQPHLLLDVRSQAEFAAGHAPNAHNVPLDALARTDRAEHAALAAGKPVVCICASGNRSAMAATVLARAGVAPVYNLAGGMLAWQAAGMSVRRGEA